MAMKVREQLALQIVALCCAVNTAAGIHQQLGWVKSHDNLLDYTLLSSRLAMSDVTCIISVNNAVADAKLATFDPGTGVCRAFKCSLGLAECRKCRNSLESNAKVWLKDARCWTTVQHRVSASVNFLRNWGAYRVGFGEGPSANYWIGLDSLHSLTSEAPRRLLILMRAWNDSQSWAQYSSFSVGPESGKFRLSISGFSGNYGVGDSLTLNLVEAVRISNDQKFTTTDSDNDNNNKNCANSYEGAWWFNDCLHSHLNGKYYTYPSALSTPNAEGIIWYSPYGYSYSLKEVEMLVI